MARGLSAASPGLSLRFNQGRSSLAISQESVYKENAMPLASAEAKDLTQEHTECTLSSGARARRNVSCAMNSCGMNRHGVPTCASPVKVRFASPLETIIGVANPDYDRSSIVVDLSKTPFALFHKDALLMAKPTSAAPPKFTCHPRDGHIIKPIDEPEKSADYEVGDAHKDSPIDGVNPPTTGSPLRRREHLGSWDSAESDAGMTDTETDLEQSDTDSNFYSEYREDEPAFYGIWKRVSSEGYEAMLRSSGVSKRAIAAAVRKHPLHIIDHDGTYFRLIVKNGLSKVDNTFFVGDEPRLEKIGDKSYEMSLNWADLTGNGRRDQLALSSICREKGEEVLAIRSLEDGGNSMVLTQVVRRPAENVEFRAKHFFKRVTCRAELRNSAGPSPSACVKVIRRGTEKV